MLEYGKGAVSEIHFEGLAEEPGLTEALDEFESAVIIAYETALQNGLSQAAALAALLEMASRELSGLALPLDERM